MNCELCGKPIPLNSLGKEDSHKLNNGKFYETIPPKTVCWKCYVDFHVKLMEEKCVCPHDGLPVKWAGTYEDWADFTCSNNHKINVNFLPSKEEYLEEQLKQQNKDWEVYYNSTEKYWFLRNEKTHQDHPKHFDHQPTPQEIKETIEEHQIQQDIDEIDKEISEDECPMGVLRENACEDDACQECEERYLIGEDIICHYFQPDAVVEGDQIQDDKGNIHTVIATEPRTLPLAHAKEGKYSIHIEPPKWEGYKYALQYSKNYGNMSGGTTEFKTKQELLDFIKTLFLEWQQFDSLLGRQGDKVTPKNLDFESFTPDITKMELFGESRLDAFFQKQQNPQQ